MTFFWLSRGKKYDDLFLFYFIESYEFISILIEDIVIISLKLLSIKNFCHKKYNKIKWHYIFAGVSSFKIQPFSFPTTSIIGKRVTTTCSTTTDGKVEFKWLKNGKEIIKNGKIIVRSFPELSNLIIDHLSEEDSGNYTCVASARGNSESYTTLLEVLSESQSHFDLILNSFCSFFKSFNSFMFVLEMLWYFVFAIF